MVRFDSNPLSPIPDWSFLRRYCFRRWRNWIDFFSWLHGVGRFDCNLINLSVPLVLSNLSQQQVPRENFMLRRRMKLAWAIFIWWDIGLSKLLLVLGRIDVGTRLDEGWGWRARQRSYFRRSKDPEKVLLLNQIFDTSKRIKKRFDTQTYVCEIT